MTERASNRAADDRRLRLSPEMASYRLLVLDFVRSYWARWGESPSYGEIAAATNGGRRSRVKKAVLSLARDRLLIRVPGPRGLRLPAAHEGALKLLRDQGWKVDEDMRMAEAPLRTKAALLGLSVLDYDPDSEAGEKGDGEAGEKRA